MPVAGVTFPLADFLNDKDLFATVNYCTRSKTYNMFFNNDSEFANIVIALRELAELWGWDVVEAAQ